jgi:tetratricopeptide (TPR) repeat protein
MNRINQLIQDGTILRDNGQGLAAVERYLEAVELATKAGNWRQAASAQHLAGVAYKVENDIERALTELHRAVELYRKAGDHDGPGRVSRDIGIAYDYRSDFKDGEVWLKRSVQELQDPDRLAELGISQSKLGLHYLQTGHLTEAEEWIGRGLVTIRRDKNWFYEMTTLLHRAGLRLEQKNNSAAIDDLEAALGLIFDSASQSVQQRRLAQIYGLLAHAYLGLANPATAKRYFADAKTLLESMTDSAAAAVRKDIKADELAAKLD